MKSEQLSNNGGLLIAERLANQLKKVEEFHLFKGSLSSSASIELYGYSQRRMLVEESILEENMTILFGIRSEDTFKAARLIVDGALKYLESNKYTRPFATHVQDEMKRREADIALSMSDLVDQMKDYFRSVKALRGTFHSKFITGVIVKFSGRVLILQFKSVCSSIWATDMEMQFMSAGESSDLPKLIKETTLTFHYDIATLEALNAVNKF